jgi:hypothetical protein
VILWASRGGNTATDANMAVTGTDNSIEDAEVDMNAAAPAAPMPLDSSAAQRGYAQFRAVSALGADGSAQIYSRNCYDALGKSFDWHQLDRCGGFDALASRWTDESEGVDSGAMSYFQSEAAATRFLQVATANGLPATDADERWARIQAMAQKTRPASAPRPAVEAVDNDSDTETVPDSQSELDSLLNASLGNSRGNVSEDP